MITPQGVVKVLDFGLAAVSQQPGTEGDPNNSPTLTMRATQAGMILGTAGYMAPEQAAGQAVDKRADIWSFGVVLWEMLTGQRLFTAHSCRSAHERARPDARADEGAAIAGAVSGERSQEAVARYRGRVAVAGINAKFGDHRRATRN